MKCIEELFEIPDVIVDIFGPDISNIILNYYKPHLVNNIKLTKHNQTDLNENEIIHNNSTILLSNISNLAKYYSETEECNEFNGVKMRFPIDEIKIIGTFKITSNKIIISRDMNMKKNNTTYKEITTKEFSKQELSSYNFDNSFYELGDNDLNLLMAKLMSKKKKLIPW